MAAAGDQPGHGGKSSCGASRRRQVLHSQPVEQPACYPASARMDQLGQHIVAQHQRGGEQQVKVVGEPGVAQPFVHTQMSGQRPLPRMGQVVHQRIPGQGRAQRGEQGWQRGQQQEQQRPSRCKPGPGHLTDLQRSSHQPAADDEQHRCGVEQACNGQPLQRTNDQTHTQRDAQRLPCGQIGGGPEQGAKSPASSYENQQLRVLAKDKADQRHPDRGRLLVTRRPPSKACKSLCRVT